MSMPSPINWLRFVHHFRGNTKAVLLDVTSQCNLNCKHCYFFSKKGNRGKADLADAEMVSLIRRTAKEHKPTICTWIGGEPMLKAEIIKQTKSLFPGNWVITNGTLPMPDWSKTVFWVSIDGTRKVHDSIRGKGVFDRAIGNIDSSDGKTMTHTTVTTRNLPELPELVDFFSKTNAGGMAFSFFNSPFRERYSLSPKEKEQAIDLLLEKKKQYSGFISMSRKQLNLMRPQNLEKVVGENCLMKEMVLAFESTGKRKHLCMYNDERYCKECGCAVPYMIYSLKNGFDLETAWLMLSKLA